MTPPNLSAYTPIFDSSHPIKPNFFMFFWNDFKFYLTNDCNSKSKKNDLTRFEKPKCKNEHSLLKFQNLAPSFFRPRVERYGQWLTTERIRVRFQ